MGSRYTWGQEHALWSSSAFSEGGVRLSQESLEFGFWIWGPGFEVPLLLVHGGVFRTSKIRNTRFMVWGLGLLFLNIL